MNAYIEKIKELWANPKMRNIAIGLASLPILFVLLSSIKERGKAVEARQERRQAAQTEESIQIFDTESVMELDQVQLAAMREDFEDEVSEQQQLVKEERVKAAKEIESLSSELAKSQKELSDLRRMVENLAQNGLPGQNNAVAKQDKQQVTPPNSPVMPVNAVQHNQPIERRQTTILTRQDPIEGRAIRTVTQRKVREVSKEGDVKVEDIETNQALTQRTPSKGDKKKNKEKDSNKAKEHFLPAGSIISGTLLNGVDAPTNNGAKNDPMPILLRVKKEAILPNFYSMDIRECHMLASASGELSSERVQMRAEAISCVLNDGKAIEKNITAYAVSSYDGKVGIHGRLVSRNGAAIARAMMAGFVGGMADGLEPQQIDAVDESPDGQTMFQSAEYKDILSKGAFNGASSAMDRLADYYTEMAENMYPVIELSAGTQVDFIVQKGMSFKLN